MIWKRNRKRHGVTLVEVIFAIGVVLIGLVGLASVMPIAARRAQDAIDLNEASALASAVFDELKAKGALQPSAWAVRNDVGAAAPGSVRFVMDAYPNATAWCIDPMYVSADVSRLADPNGFYTQFQAGGGNGYRRLLFPHYRADQNPLIDPSQPFSDPWGTPAGIRPRMLRVGIVRQQQDGLLRPREAEALVESLDGLATAKSKDRSLSVVAQTGRAVAGGSALGKRLTDGSLTWIATCNSTPGSRFMNVSIVIIRNRDRGFFTYRVSDTNDNDIGPATDSDQNSLAERLAYVSSATGFSGGAGGSVQLIGPAEDDTVSPTIGGISPRIVTNDWIMLSRRLPPGGDVHRWFRVASVDEEPEFLDWTDPVSGDTRRVWRRTLFLDGPDWSFGFPMPPGVGADAAGNVAGDIRFHTYATIVDDVVAVSEHMIRLQ